MRAVAPDFFVANGDMIYGDNSCPPEGPDGSGPWQNIPGDFQGVDSSSVDWTNLARTRDVYLRHWRYNRADRHLRAFLARTPIYSQWDDHEVINDFGAAWTFWNQASASRPGYPTLVAAGRSAFLDYAVLASPRIYRSFRWGRDLELFLLDNRSYRSRNDLPDTAANAKTMLGAEQFAWLLQSLRESSSTWKVVSSNVPLSVATGTPQARDGWASGTDSPSASDTGFERELLSLLAGLDAANVRNLVFVATDMHYPASFRYEHDYNGDGDTLVFHEFVTGPLSATRAGPRPPDATARPTVLYAEGNLFNFGLYNVLRAADGTTHFTAEVRDETGAQRPGSRIELSPR